MLPASKMDTGAPAESAAPCIVKLSSSAPTVVPVSAYVPAATYIMSPGPRSYVLKTDDNVVGVGLELQSFGQVV